MPSIAFTAAAGTSDEIIRAVGGIPE